MGRRKSKRAGSAVRAPADLSALPLPAWVAADATTTDDAHTEPQPGRDAVLDAVSRRVRKLHSALTTAALPAAQLAALRAFKSTLHEWLPRKRRISPIDDKSKHPPMHPRGTTADTLAEARVYSYMLQLYAWPAPRVPLLRATVRGLLEALAPPDVRDAACAALQAAGRKQSPSSPAERKKEPLDATGATTGSLETQAQQCPGRDTIDISSHVVRAALQTVAALGQAAASQLEVQGAAAGLEVEVVGAETRTGRKQAQAQAQSSLNSDTCARAEHLLGAANALLEYAPTKLALVVVCGVCRRGTRQDSRCDAAASEPEPSLQPMQPLTALLALASSLICSRMTDLSDEIEDAQRAAAAVQACQRALPSVIALLRLHVRTQLAVQSRLPILSPLSSLTSETPDAVITTSDNVASSSSSAATIGVACLRALALAGAGNRHRLASLLEVVRGFRSQAAACALLALQVAETDESTLAARLTGALEERSAPMASRLALARALAGAASHELLLLPLPARTSRADSTDSDATIISGHGRERAGSDRAGAASERSPTRCFLGDLIPDIALEAAAAATPSERTWALDCLRAWLLRVTDLCDGVVVHQTVSATLGPAADVATSTRTRLVAQPRLASVAAAALRCWGHADVKLGKMAALVLGAAAVAERTLGASSSAAQAQDGNKRSVLALVLAQPTCSAHKYTALISIVPYLSGLTSLLQGMPSAAAISPHEESEERTGKVIGEAREGSETFAGDTCNRNEIERVGGGAAALLAAMRSAWTDPRVASNAAAVVVAVLQRAVQAVKEEQAHQRQRSHTDVLGPPTSTHLFMTREALVSHCRVHWLSQLAAAMLGHHVTRGLTDKGDGPAPHVDHVRARAAQTALPVLLKFDSRAGPAIAVELRRQASVAGVLLQPSALQTANAMTQGAALLRALISLAEAHGRGGMEGNIIEWKEIEAAAVHADPELRATAMRAVLRGAGTFAVVDDDRGKTASADVAALARLPSARALLLVCRSFGAELMLVPSSQASSPMPLPIPLPILSESKEGSAQSIRACMRLLISQLARAQHGARLLQQRQKVKLSATMSAGTVDALRRAGNARADITHIALAAVLAPAHWVLSSSTAASVTDTTAVNETEDTQDGRDVESSVVLVTALDVLLAIVQQWQPAEINTAGEYSSDSAIESNTLCDDLLLPPIGPILFGDQRFGKAPDSQISSTLPALIKRLLLLLSHPQSSVRAHAESLLVALTPSQASCLATTAQMLPKTAIHAVLHQCLGAQSANSTSVGLVAAPRRAEAHAGATAVAILHRFGDSQCGIPVTAGTTASASNASNGAAQYAFFGIDGGASLRLLAFVVSRLEQGLEAQQVPSCTPPPLLHGLLLCVGRVIAHDINWTSIVAQQNLAQSSVASVTATAMWSVRKLVLRCMAAIGSAVALSLRVVAEAGTEGGGQSTSDSGSSCESESDDDAGPHDGTTIPAVDFYEGNAATGSGSNLAVGGRCSETVLEARARDGGGEMDVGNDSAVAARVAGAWMCVSEGAAALAVLLKRLLPLLSLEPLALVPSPSRAQALDSMEVIKGQLMFGGLVGGIVKLSAWKQANMGAGEAPSDLLDAHEAACVLRLLLRALLRLKHVGALGATANALQTGLESVLLLATRHSEAQQSQVDADASAARQQWRQDLQLLLSLPRAMLTSLCREAMGVRPNSKIASTDEVNHIVGHQHHQRYRRSQRRYLLRRSAGFAAAFLAIARAEPAMAPPVLLKRATTALLMIAAGDVNHNDDPGSAVQITPTSNYGSGHVSPFNGTDDDNVDSSASWRRRVHAMNVLRLLCRDGRLGASLQSLRVACPVVRNLVSSNQSLSKISSECEQPQEQALACALVIAVQGFLDSHWAVRNSSLMLFAAAIQRSLGGNRMTDQYAGSGVHSAGAGLGVLTSSCLDDSSNQGDSGDIRAPASKKSAAAGAEPGASAFPTADAFFKSFPLLRCAFLEHLETIATAVEGSTDDATFVAARATAAAALHPPLVLLARLWRPDDSDESVSQLVAGLHMTGKSDAQALEQANWLRHCASMRCLASLYNGTMAARRGWPLWQRLVALSLRAATSVDAMVRSMAARALPAAVPPAALPILLQSLGAAVVESTACFSLPGCRIARSSAPPAGVSLANLLHGRLLQLSAALRAMRVSHGGDKLTLLSLRGVLAGAAAVCGTGFGAGAGAGAALGVGGGEGAGTDGVCADSASDSDSDTGDGATSVHEIHSVAQSDIQHHSLPASVPRSVLRNLTALICADPGHTSMRVAPPPIADAALQCLVELTDLTAAGTVSGWLCDDTEENNVWLCGDEKAASKSADSSLWSEALAAICRRAMVARLGASAPAPALHMTMSGHAPHASSICERAVATVAALALTLKPTHSRYAHEELLCLLRDTAPVHMVAIQSKGGHELRLLRRTALAALVHALREYHLLPLTPADRRTIDSRLCAICTELLGGLSCWAKSLVRPRTDDADSAASIDSLHAWQRFVAVHAPTLALELRVLLLLQHKSPPQNESESKSTGASLLAIATHCAGTCDGTPAVLRSAGCRALRLLGLGLGKQLSLCSREVLLPLIHRVWTSGGEHERKVAATVLDAGNLLRTSRDDVETTTKGWCLALEMLANPTSPARAMAAAARAVCCAASVQAWRTVDIEHVDISTAAVAAQVAVAQLSHLPICDNFALHNRYAHWVLCAATKALGLVDTRGTCAASDAGTAAAAATARAAIAFACRRRPVFEPVAAVSAATAAATACAVAPITNAMASGAVIAPIHNDLCAQEASSPLPAAAPEAAYTVARLCLPTLAQSLATASASVRQQAAEVCTGAMSLLAALVPWATGVASPPATSLPDLRPWADAPGAVVSTCVSYHPPVFASMVLAATTVQTLAPQVKELEREHVSHFVANVGAVLQRNFSGDDSGSGSEVGDGEGTNNELHPLLLPVLELCVKAATARSHE